MVYLAPSGFLRMLRIRYKIRIETLSKLIPQYKFEASVLEISGKINVENAYIDGFVYQNESKLKNFAEFLNFQKSDGSSRPGKF